MKHAVYRRVTEAYSSLYKYVGAKRYSAVVKYYIDGGLLRDQMVEQYPNIVRYLTHRQINSETSISGIGVVMK